MDRFDHPETDEPAGTTLAVYALLQGIPPDAWIDGTVIDQGIRLDRLRALQGLAHFLAQEIEDTLIGAMDSDHVDLPGIGRLVRSETSSSKWSTEHASDRMREDLARAVATSIALDIATGAIDTTRRNIALAAINAAYEAIPSFSSLKVAGRSRFGLHIGDYRTYSTSYKVTVEHLEGED